MINVENLPNAYKEVFVILNNMEKESIDKIPDNFKQMIKEKMNSEYQFEINAEDDFDNLVILQETKTILAYIFLNYWATENQKKVIKHKFKKEFIEKEKLKVKTYREKDIFKNKEIESKVKNETENNKLIVYNNRKVLNKIKQFFILILKKIRGKND